MSKAVMIADEAAAIDALSKALRGQSILCDFPDSEIAAANSVFLAAAADALDEISRSLVSISESKEGEIEVLPI